MNDNFLPVSNGPLEIINPNMDIEKALREIEEIEVYVPYEFLNRGLGSYAVYRQNSAILRYSAQFRGMKWSERSGEDADGKQCKIIRLYKPEQKEPVKETTAHEEDDYITRSREPAKLPYPGAELVGIRKPDAPIPGQVSVECTFEVIQPKKDSIFKRIINWAKQLLSM